MPELGAVCQQDSVGGALNGIFLNRALADLIVRDAIFDVDPCAGNKNLANVVILIRITTFSLRMPRMITSRLLVMMVTWKSSGIKSVISPQVEPLSIKIISPLSISRASKLAIFFFSCMWMVFWEWRKLTDGLVRETDP